MQRRLQSYGDPIVASDVKEMLNSLADPVVLFGFDFFVDAVNRMSISPGACITNQGIMVIESETQYLVIDNTADAKSYTIIYSHEDENIVGGSPAKLEAVLGLRTSDPTGVVIGWVKYLGSSVALAQSHFFPRRKANITEFNTVDDTHCEISPLLPKMFPIANGGGTLTITDKYDTTTFSVPKAYLEVKNDDIITGYKTFVLPMRAGLYAPGQIVVSAYCPLGSQITVRAIGKDGSILIPDTNQITGTSNFVYRRMMLPKNGVIIKDAMFYLEIRFDLNFNKVLYLEAIGYNTYNYPI